MKVCLRSGEKFRELNGKSPNSSTEFTNPIINRIICRIIEKNRTYDLTNKSPKRLNYMYKVKPLQFEEDKFIGKFFDILDLVKFELKFYKYKEESPMFERIVKTRVFQTNLQKLKDFISQYFEIMYEGKDSPINQPITITI